MSFDCIHALFGALLGLFAGLYLYSELANTTPTAWLAIPITTTTLALAAGFLTDTFWERAATLFWW